MKDHHIYKADWDLLTSIS